MISREKIYSYFDQNHEGMTPSSNGWYTCVCPYCDSRKLAVHPDHKVVKCWKGCVPTTYIPYFVKDYYYISYFEAVETLEEQEENLIKIPQGIVRASRSDVELPPGFRPILGSDSSLGDRARKYLKQRGFDLNFMDRLGIGYCTEEAKRRDENYFGYLIVPFYKEGKLAYFIGRDLLDRGESYRYKNPAKSKYGVGKSEVMFNESALHLYEKVYITEGWADAATIGEKGLSTQGLIFSRIQLNLIIKSPVKELVIVPDAGAYIDGLRNARKLVDHKKVRVMNLDGFKLKGAGKDVNEIGWDILKGRQYDHPVLTMNKWFNLMRKARQ